MSNGAINAIEVPVIFKDAANSAQNLVKAINENVSKNLNIDSTVAKRLEKAKKSLNNTLATYTDNLKIGKVDESGLKQLQSGLTNIYKQSSNIGELLSSIDLDDLSVNATTRFSGLIDQLATLRTQLEEIETTYSKLRDIRVGDLGKFTKNDDSAKAFNTLSDIIANNKIDAKLDSRQGSERFKEEANKIIPNLSAQAEELDGQIVQLQEKVNQLTDVKNNLNVQKEEIDKILEENAKNRKTLNLTNQLYDALNVPKENITAQERITRIQENVQALIKDTFVKKDGFLKAGNSGTAQVEALLNALGFNTEEINNLLGQKIEQIKDAISKKLKTTNKINDVFKAVSSQKENLSETINGIDERKQINTQERTANTKQLKSAAAQIDQLQKQKNDIQETINSAKAAIGVISNDFQALKNKLDELQRKSTATQADIKDTNKQLNTAITGPAAVEVENIENQNNKAKGNNSEYQGLINQKKELNNFGGILDNLTTRFFSFGAVVGKVRQLVHQAWTEIKSLDKAMTNISVVTTMTNAELWGQIDSYMALAQQYGVTTQGVYEVSQLYYQQGLSTAQVNELTTETLKMARRYPIYK